MNVLKIHDILYFRLFAPADDGNNNNDVFPTNEYKHSQYRNSLCCYYPSLKIRIRRAK